MKQQYFYPQGLLTSKMDFAGLIGGIDVFARHTKTIRDLVDPVTTARIANSALGVLIEGSQKNDLLRSKTDIAGLIGGIDIFTKHTKTIRDLVNAASTTSALGIKSTLDFAGIDGFRETAVQIAKAQGLLGLSRDEVLERLHTSHVLEDPDVPELIDSQVAAVFDDLPEAETLLAETAEALQLTLPFGYDRSVRAGLQVITVAAVVAALCAILLVFPWASTLLTLTGTPTPAKTWKATGAAYDKIFGRQNNHPERAKKTKTGHKDKGVW